MKANRNIEPDVRGDFSKFKDFARQIMSVPRSAIQPQLDAEKERKRTPKASASRDSGVSSKNHSSQA